MGSCEGQMSSHPQQLFENRVTVLVWEGFFWAHTRVLSLLGKSCPSACPGSEESLAFPLRPRVFLEEAPPPPGPPHDDWVLGSSQGNPREFPPVFTSPSLGARPQRLWRQEQPKPPESLWNPLGGPVAFQGVWGQPSQAQGRSGC